MSKIIKFPLERTNQPFRSEQSGEGELVIFPGVRIERERVQESCLQKVKPNHTPRSSTLNALRKQVGKIKET